MKTIDHVLVLSAVAGLCLWRCADNDHEDEEDRARNSSRDLDNATATFIYNAIPPGAHAQVSVAYSTAINTFSVNLLKTVYASAGYLNTNVILSPFSVSRNLAVIAEGSSGESRQELLSALGGQAALDDARAALAELLYADNSIVFQCADAVWVDSNEYSVVESFRDTVNCKYGVEVGELDFADAAGAAGAVNGWVDANTNHRITSVIEEEDFTDATAAVLANAVYFEADWASPFDVTRTQPHDFAGPGGTVTVEMMESDYRFDTRKTDAYENAKLYYGTNSTDYFYLDVYMPTTMTVEQFLQDSCLAVLSRDGTDSTGLGTVRMPKFFFTTKCDLIPVLKQLGVNRVFNSSSAEITDMVRTKSGQQVTLYIEKVIHKAGIRTDEEGTEAYAVTVSTAGVTSAGPDSPDVVFDRPFVYFIRAGANGLVLFAGVVNSPGS